jgi:hypothetical protein
MSKQRIPTPFGTTEIPEKRVLGVHTCLWVAVMLFHSSTEKAATTQGVEYGWSPIFISKYDDLTDTKRAEKTANFVSKSAARLLPG